jgi:hypothetical protein
MHLRSVLRRFETGKQKSMGRGVFFVCVFTEESHAPSFPSRELPQQRPAGWHMHMLGNGCGLQRHGPDQCAGRAAAYRDDAVREVEWVCRLVSLRVCLACGQKGQIRDSQCEIDVFVCA